MRWNLDLPVDLYTTLESIAEDFEDQFGVEIDVPHGDALLIAGHCVSIHVPNDRNINIHSIVRELEHQLKCSLIISTMEEGEENEGFVCLDASRAEMRSPSVQPDFGYEPFQHLAKPVRSVSPPSSDESFEHVSPMTTRDCNIDLVLPVQDGTPSSKPFQWDWIGDVNEPLVNDETMEGATDSATEEPSSEEPTATEESIFEATTEESIFEATTEESIFEAATEESIFEATTEESIFDAATEESIFEAATEESIFEAATEEPISNAATKEPIPEEPTATEESIFEATTEESIFEAATEESIFEAATEEPIPNAVTEEPIPEEPTATEESISNAATTEKSIFEEPTASEAFAKEEPCVWCSTSIRSDTSEPISSEPRLTDTLISMERRSVMEPELLCELPDAVQDLVRRMVDALVQIGKLPANAIARVGTQITVDIKIPDDAITEHQHAELWVRLVESCANTDTTIRQHTENGHVFVIETVWERSLGLFRPLITAYVDNDLCFEGDAMDFRVFNPQMFVVAVLSYNSLHGGAHPSRSDFWVHILKKCMVYDPRGRS